MVGLSIWVAVAFLGIALLFVFGHTWGFAILAAAVAGLAATYTTVKTRRDGAES